MRRQRPVTLLPWVIVLQLAWAWPGLASPAAFSGPFDYEPGAQVRSISVGDFNEDGNPDLAIAEYDTAQVVVYLGRGDGTFGSREVFAVAGPAFASAAADVNGDGHVDLVVATSVSQVSVLLGLGNGTFLPRRDSPVSAPPLSVEVADFDHDSNPDLVFGNAGSSVDVLWGDGQGGFGADSTYRTADKPLGVTVADFNHDGNLDIAASALGHITCCYHVSVLIGTGSRSFLAKADYPSGFWPRSIASGDFNQDGYPDLLAADEQGGFQALINRGDGTFDPLATGWSNSGQAGSHLFDFDRDGILDAAVATAEGIELGRGQGDGRFVLCDTLGTSHGRSFVTSADLNHDQWPDVICDGEGAAVFLNITPLVSAGPIPSALSLAMPVPNPARSSIAFHFALPSSMKADLSIYDVAGRLVKTLLSEPMTSGTHQTTWNLKTSEGRAVPRGIYFARLEAGSRHIVRRVEILP